MNYEDSLYFGQAVELIQSEAECVFLQQQAETPTA